MTFDTTRKNRQLVISMLKVQERFYKGLLNRFWSSKSQEPLRKYLYNVFIALNKDTRTQVLQDRPISSRFKISNISITKTFTHFEKKRKKLIECTRHRIRKLKLINSAGATIQEVFYFNSFENKQEFKMVA